MKYKGFNIVKYKGICEPINILLHSGVYPIIGLNESGKTTILKAISSFDAINDKLYPEHTANVGNRQNDDSMAIIEATVEIERQEIRSIAGQFKDRNNDAFSDLNAVLGKTNDAIDVAIKRTINGKKTYSINISEWDQVFDPQTQHEIAEKIVEKMPPILYFDDFRDIDVGAFEVTCVIEDGNKTTSSKSNFVLEGLRLLFDESYTNQTNRKTIEDLFIEGMDDAISIPQIKSLLDAYIKSNITTKWNEAHAITGESNPHIELSIGNLETSRKGDRTILKRTFEFIIKENKNNGMQIPFKISERSKGFMWYFAYIYKTHLNPKRLNDRKNVIYLLDEPGCYLHAHIQKELCKTFSTLGNEKENIVIYNTHIPYLLTEELLPNLLVAYKENNNIFLKKFSQVPGTHYEAFEPLRTAFGLTNTVFEHTKNHVIITEGLSDFYAFSAVNQDSEVQVLPSTGAQNTDKMLAWALSMNKNAIVLLDDDDEGRAVIKKYENNLEYKGYFMTLGDGRELEDLFDTEEIKKEMNDQTIDRNNAKRCIPILYKNGKIERMTNSVAKIKSALESVLLKLKESAS